MGNVSEHILVLQMSPDSIPEPRITDSFLDRSHHHHRYPEDRRLFRTQTEAQGNCRLRYRHHTDSAQMGIRRICG